MRNFRLFTTTMLACAVPLSAFAQEPAVPNSLGRVAGSKAQQPNVRAPAADVGAGYAGSGFEIAADGDDKTVSLTGTRSWQDVSTATLASNSLTAKVFSDISDKRDSSGFFVTDFGRVQGSGLQLGFARTWSEAVAIPKSAAELRVLYAALVTKCEGSEKTKTEEDRKKCGKMDALQIAEYLSEDDVQVVMKAIGGDQWENITTWMLAVDSSVSGKDYKVRNTNDFKEGDVGRADYSLSVSFGASWVPERLKTGRVYTGGGVAYKKSHKDAKSRIFCATVATPPTECYQGAYANPSEKTEVTAFLVARNQFPYEMWGVPVIVQLRPAYDFENEVVGLETSLYLFSSAKSWKGGVRLKVQSDDNSDETDDENAMIGVFVGKGF